MNDLPYKAYDAGRRAKQLGKPLHACPYTVTDDRTATLRLAWIDGWLEEVAPLLESERT